MGDACSVGPGAGSACAREELLVPDGDGERRISFLHWRPATRREGPRVVVLCLHGLTRCGRDFEYVGARLAASGVEVAAPDAAGRGASGRLSHAASYGYATYVRDTRALAAHLLAGEEGARLHVLGTSMGGLVGMLMAAPQAHESPAVHVARLAINDIGPEVPAVALQRLAKYVGKEPAPFASMAAAEQCVRESLAPFGALTDEQWAFLTEVSTVRDGQGRLVMHYDPAIAQAFAGDATARDLSMWPAWEAVPPHTPVMLVRGAESDVLPSAVVSRMRASGPGIAAFLEVPHVGHAPALLDAAQVDPILDFLLATDP